MKEVTSENFERETRQGAVVVDFWAEWCAPCKQLNPMLEQVKKEVPKVNILKVNIDQNQKLAKMFGVRGVPVLVFMKNGKEVSRNVGLLTATEFKAKAQQLL